MKITIIGGGNMGNAIAKALLNNSSLEETVLHVCEREKSRWTAFQDLEVILSEQLAPENIKSASVIILAVKPQDINTVLIELQPLISDQLIISIAAGISLKTLEDKLKTQKITRVMPNTPALIGEGISGWFAGKKITTKDKQTVKLILSSFGQEIEVGSEDQINAVTALSGSGPAYFFYFLRSLIDGALEIGLKEDQARLLALQTAVGAAKLALVSVDSLQVLQDKVTSKGGTTAAALQVFSENKLDQIIQKALQKAYNRAKELSS